MDEYITSMMAFPAHAGMSRLTEKNRLSQPGVPRARGDEPAGNINLDRITAAFPAHAGMSRPSGLRERRRWRRSPRTRG